MLSKIASSASEEIANLMPLLVPCVSALMWDTKKQVKKTATQSMKAICGAIDNIDLKPFIPALIEAITHPEEVADCVYALALLEYVSEHFLALFE